MRECWTNIHCQLSQTLPTNTRFHHRKPSGFTTRFIAEPQRSQSLMAGLLRGLQRSMPKRNNSSETIGSIIFIGSFFGQANVPCRAIRERAAAVAQRHFSAHLRLHTGVGHACGQVGQGLVPRSMAPQHCTQGISRSLLHLVFESWMEATAI